MRILIIGAGIMGLSIGWQLAKRGYKVEIFEKSLAGKGASFAAAGMLAPYAEAGFEDDEQVSLFQKSLALYPEFLQELNLSFESTGTLYIGIDRDDRTYLEHLFKEMEQKGYPIQWISKEEALAIEPLLSPRLSAALFFPTEPQINNRHLLSALITTFQRQGGLIHEMHPVEGIWEENGTLKGILAGEKIAGDIVINAAGAWSSLIYRHATPIYPNKGQIVTLTMAKGMQLSHVIRTPRVYLAPKRDGQLRIGATSEKVGFDQTVTGGGLLELLKGAFEAVPSIEFMGFQEAIASLRPESNDRLPCIEETSLKNYFRTTGHGRAGILLAPYTAHQMRSLIEDKLCTSN